MRKIRVALENRGKSGGARVLYVGFTIRGAVGLLYAYSKSEKENLDNDERRILKAMVEQIYENWRNSE